MDPNVPSAQSVASPSGSLSASPSTPLNVSTPASQQPSPKSRFSKKLIIVIGIFLVIVIGIVVYFLLPKNPQTQRQGNITQPDATNFPYEVVNSQGVENTNVIKEMAREISDYVLSQRRDDGYYNYLAHYKEQCVGEKCPFNGVDVFKTTNAWTALALFSASQILEDSNLLSQAKTDLNKLEEFCAIDRKECNWVLAQPAIIYQTTQDPELLEFLRIQGETLLSSAPSDNTMLVAIEARELTLLYEIFQDTRYIVAAQNRLLLSSQKLDDERDLYPSQTLKFSESSCWVSLANAQLASTTQNEQEKNNTKVFLGNGRISEHFNYFYQPITIQPCIESYAIIGSSSEAKSILMQFIDNFYDGQKRKLIYGEGGTIFQPDSESKLVGLTDSSYTLYLLNLIN